MMNAACYGKLARARAGSRQPSIDVWRPSQATLALFLAPAVLIFAGFTA